MHEGIHVHGFIGVKIFCNPSPINPNEKDGLQIVVIEEIAILQFLLFPQCFLIYQGCVPSSDPYLILYQITNFRLFQIERLCRRQFKI